VGLSARHWRIQVKKETKREEKLRQAASKELWRKSYNDVLLSEDPHIWLDDENGFDFEQSLGMAMEDFFQYIRACYFIDANPLPHLRKYCPKFKWEFHRDVSLEKIPIVFGSVDYIWTGEDFDTYITATQIGRNSPRVLCYHPKKIVIQAHKLKEVFPIVRFVSDGNEETVGTVIT
jgi:hypothetical protein